MNTVLVTGGGGYIGSHTCVELINTGFKPVIIDNFSNSNEGVIKRIEKISNLKIDYINCDLSDKENIKKIIKDFNCEAVIHFAGLKAVGESEELPLKYYKNNVEGTISLLEAMTDSSLKKIVFSSSATVYGDPNYLPIDESHELNPNNVYGETKLVIENLLRNLYKSDPKWKIFILRYFNPVGAHQSGLIGDDPKGIPNNLMPFLSQVAVGERSHLKIWGNDYQTNDGTGVRDYIHVVDLAKGHIKALENLDKINCEEINLGTGRGYSVLEIIKAFEKTNKIKINYEFHKRRKGDIDANYANPAKAKDILNWQAKLNINDMCSDTWRWQRMNPKGIK